MFYSSLYQPKPKKKSVLSYIGWTLIPLFFVALAFGFLTNTIDDALLFAQKTISDTPYHLQEMRNNSRQPRDLFSDDRDYLAGIPIKEILRGGNKYEISELAEIPEVDAQAFVVGDVLTGEIILAKNEDEVLPIASVTKLMTASVALDELKETHIATVSQKATLTESSRGMLRANEELEVSDLLYPLLLVSSNDAAEVLAETFGRKYFMQSMNRRANEIGMAHTSFDDPSGLSEKNLSTAKDLFLLSEYLYNNHDSVFEITKLEEYTQGGRTWNNANRFTGTTNYEGGKTGYTSKAHRTGVALFKVPIEGYGERVIAISVLRTDNRTEDYNKLLAFVDQYVKYTTPPQNSLSEYEGDGSVRLAFMGDVMFDRGVKSSVTKNFGGDYAKLFENLTELKDADISFVNLEGPISDAGKNVGSKYSFRFVPEIASVLKKSGIDIVSFANNHVGDWSLTAFKDTLTHLEQAGVLWTGAGQNKQEASSVTIVESQGIKIGFLGFSDVGPTWIEAKEDQAGQLVASDPNRLRYIEEAKQKVDILVVSYHWGDEYKPHNERQTALAHSSIDSGADIIIGHHPHVTQDLELYKDGLIAYSLGNGIFDQHFSKETMEGMLLTIDVSREGLVSYQEKNFVINTKYQPESPTLVSEAVLGEVMGIFDEDETVSISWVGDIVPGNPEKDNLEDANILFSDAKQWIKQADIAIGNLEGVLTQHKQSKCWFSKSKFCFAFKSEASFARALRLAGFDVINVANNHSFDFGEEGFKDTVTALEAEDLVSVGTKGSISYSSKNDIMVGLVSFSHDYRLNPIQDLEVIKTLTRQASENSDIVVVLFHGGAEGSKHQNTPNETETYLGENRGNLVKAAQIAIENGADAVFNSGPHVVRGIEFFKNKPIVYSAGNFVGYNTLFLDEYTSRGLGVMVEIAKNGTFVSGTTQFFDLKTNGIPKPIKDGREDSYEINKISRNDFRDSAGIIYADGTFRYNPNQIVWNGVPLESSECPKSNTNHDSDILAFDIANTKIPRDFVPRRLVALPEQTRLICVEEETAQAFIDMNQAAEQSDISLVATSGFRDYSIQEQLFTNWKQKNGARSKYLAIAPPGHSEHHLGTTLDLSSQEINFESASQKFEKTKTYEWLVENAASYGFVQSYKKGSEEITGYIPESWHWRYVGIDHALAIEARNLSTAEYFGQETQFGG